MNAYRSLRVFHLGAVAVLLTGIAACGHAGTPAMPAQTAADSTILSNALGAASQAAPKPAIYVANAQTNSVSVFLEAANGNVAPSAKIAGSATGLHAPLAVAVAANGRIYVANSTNTIEIFRAGANGNIAPMTTIMCGGLNKPSALALDGAGNLYAANAAGNSVSVFGPAATGCVSGNHVISGASTQLHMPMGIAASSGKIFVSNFSSNSIVTFAAGATGNIAPSAALSGALTKLSQPEALAFNIHGNLFAANAASVTEYAPGAKGNVAPIRTIAGAATTLARSAGVASSISGRIIVLDASRAVDTFAAAANGNVAPAQRVTGSATGLSGSTSAAIFEPLQVVGINLFGTSASNVPPYGTVHGYLNGTAGTVSQVVHLTAGDPVVFKNVDGGYLTAHTGSFLGNATATSVSYPASFNGSASTSPAGTAIGTPHFSTGSLNANQTSGMYFATPGFYILGCAFHYNGFGMRTVVVAQ